MSAPSLHAYDACRRQSVALAGGAMDMLDMGRADRPIGVVFLHATGFHAQVYQGLLDPTSRHVRVVAPDLRGHGASSLPVRPDKLRSWAVYRDDVIAFLDAVAAEPVALAGHSMGATVAVHVAAARPDLVRSLVLIEPVIGPAVFHIAARLAPARAMLKQRFPIAVAAARRRARFDNFDAAFSAYKQRGAFKTWPDAVLRDYVEGGFVEDGDGVVLRCPPSWEAATFCAQGLNPWPAIARVRAPASVILAQEASTCPPRVADRLARALPSAAVSRISGTTHFLPMERPELVQAALAGALTR